MIGDAGAALPILGEFWGVTPLGSFDLIIIVCEGCEIAFGRVAVEDAFIVIGATAAAREYFSGTSQTASGNSEILKSITITQL